MITFIAGYLIEKESLTTKGTSEAEITGHEVLTAQQSLLSAELSQVNDRLQQLEATVNLYRDLGGGWK